jgi:hypothetical protein
MARSGKLRLAVSRHVRTLRDDGELTSEPLAELALKLAESLDEGAGLATAAVARELRQTLEAMAPKGTDDSDDEFAQFLAGLSQPSVLPPEVGDR